MTIMILNKVFFSLGLTELVEARIGRRAVRTATQLISFLFTILTNKSVFPCVLALPADQSLSARLPLFGKLSVCSIQLPHISPSLFLFLLLALPPSPASLPANTSAGFLPGLPAAPFPFPPHDSPPPPPYRLPFNVCSSPSLGQTLLPRSPLSPPVPPETPPHQHTGTGSPRMQPNSVPPREHLPAPLPTPSGFTPVLEIPVVSNGRLRGKKKTKHFSDEIFLCHDLETAPSST